MAETLTPEATTGASAHNFRLPATDGRSYSLDDCRGEKGTLVMFICNHCPFVRAIRPKIVRDAAELLEHDVRSVAIMSNDPTDYPEDSFDNMKKAAEEFGFPFPYLLDETQEIAKSYGAVCTPDFFGYDKDLNLQYRGRLDDSGMKSNTPDAARERFEAMTAIAATGAAPAPQNPSIGCSIKWR